MICTGFSFWGAPSSGSGGDERGERGGVGVRGVPGPDV